MTTMYDKLMNASISQHGYWLINHQSAIGGDLLELLEKVGLQQAILTVNDYKGEFMKRMYAKIEAQK